MQTAEHPEMTAWHLIARLGVPKIQDGEPLLDQLLEMVDTFPEIIDLLLADFDYTENIESTRAVVCRILASYWNVIYRRKFEALFREEHLRGENGQSEE